MPKVTDEHRAAQRERIQQAAIAVARRKGVQAATMGDIISESGLSAGAIYGYYAGKEELILDLARTVLSSRAEVAEQLANTRPVPPPAQALSFLFGGLPTDWLEGGLLLQFWGVATTQPQVLSSAAELGQKMSSVLQDYLVAWFGENGADEQQARERASTAAPALLGLAQGYVLQRSLGLVDDYATYSAAVAALVGGNGLDGRATMGCQPTRSTKGNPMPEVLAYATDDKSCQFHKTTITRREPGPTEVFFEVKYAGICHSDIHTAREEWGPVVAWPLVPGHELAGVVTQVGDKVDKFKVGDKVGVGCFVDSCGECEYCQQGQEQFCVEGNVATYNAIGRDGKPTDGGYSQGITVEQDYVLHIPEQIPFEKAAPLLCAGITTYSPLKRWGAGPGKKVAVVGMGGLGHMGVQIAAAMGAEVSVISQTMSKEVDGKAFGATNYYATSEEGTLEKLRGTFDLVLSTISADYDVDAILGTLKVGGTLVNVGAPEKPVDVAVFSLIGGNKNFAGSMIGGIAETQEMLDFCAEHGIAPQVEMISGEDITEAYDKVVASKVRYRYVIDTSTF